MCVRNVLRLALIAIAVSLIGCDPAVVPTAPVGEDGFSLPSHGAGANEEEVTEVPRPTRPLRGPFTDIEFSWFVNHFAEAGCGGGLVAGAEARATGHVTALGRIDAVASAAWDWSVSAAGVYTPTGPGTGTSATVMTMYPHAFCSVPVLATGSPVLTQVNGDEVHGVVSGGEVYELGFNVPGDGQEQFIEVTIVGGTGRFENATGFFVIHAVVDIAAGEPLVIEIMPGGEIRYSPARPRGGRGDF